MITAVLDIKGWTAQPYLTKNMTFDVPYIVTTTSTSEDGVAIEASGVLPAYASPYPGNPYLAVADCKLKREDAQPLIWRATITYKADSLSQEELDRQQYPNPCDRPPDFDWSSVAYDVIATTTVEDYTPPGRSLIPAGTPIVNTALDKPDPPVEETEFYWTVNFQKFVPNVPSWVRSFAGRVNDSSYTLDGETIPEGCSRMTNLRIGRRQRENGFSYRELTGTIELREIRQSRFAGDSVPTPFITEIRNDGYSWNTGTSGGRILSPAYSSPGVINTSPTAKGCQTPYPLNALGAPLENPTLTNTYYLQFRTKRTADFNLLPLS